MNSTSIELAQARARAQRLASRIGFEHPWANAAEELRAAEEAERQRRAAEVERSEAAEAERFAKAFAEYRRLVAELADRGADEKAKLDEITALGADAPVAYARVTGWLTSTQAQLWRQEHQMAPTEVMVAAPKPPKGPPPPGFTWPQIELAELYRKKLLERDAIRQRVGSICLQLDNFDREWPALSDLRNEA